ncbi:hypothetical protein [Vibrio casei]|uniref:hypothetical protein n=1 Tax=Vibrio casei TaxID=673372 RepID=UPI000DA6AE74|nr:hypothetical protein [Vibrio casei]
MDVITNALNYSLGAQSRLYELSKPLPELVMQRVTVEGEDIELMKVIRPFNNDLKELIEWKAFLELAQLDELEDVFISDRYKKDIIKLYHEFPQDPEVQDLYLDLVVMGIIDPEIEQNNNKNEG